MNVVPTAFPCCSHTVPRNQVNDPVPCSLPLCKREQGNGIEWGSEAGGRVNAVPGTGKREKGHNWTTRRRLAACSKRLAKRESRRLPW